MFQEPELTEEEKAKEEVKAFVQRSNTLAKMIEDGLTMLFNKVWRNPNVTAKKFFEILGPQGKKAFDDSWELQQLVKKINPAFEYLVPPLPYTIDEATGIVSVSEKQTEGEPA